ncbi:MAG: hypothetical protein GTO12_04340 [Proteobacteria bacterium]|nr:hypothetical protein [Pseudomonadota bacterium]
MQFVAANRVSRDKRAVLSNWQWVALAAVILLIAVVAIVVWLRLSHPPVEIATLLIGYWEYPLS